MTKVEPVQGAVGRGLATIARDGSLLEAWFPSIMVGAVDRTGSIHPQAEALAAGLERPIDGLVREDGLRDVRVVPIETRISDLMAPARDLADVYLRLQLLSARRLTPDRVSLAGLLDSLVEVAWTTVGPCRPARVEEARWIGRREGIDVQVVSLWPFPRMTDYVLPAGVRIMNADNVRLGAYLAPGTNVLGGGFCQTGSATLGPTAIEGRLSLGVMVGSGSHIGGGASLMGTTSGGGKHRVSIGRNCLIGANAGVGIALGDGCVVEAGCYVTAGSKVTMPDGSVVTAAGLSGRSKLLFRRNSIDGRIEVLGDATWPGLNLSLHLSAQDENGRGGKDATAEPL